MTISDAIHAIVEGRHLTREEARGVMNEVMSGRVSDAQIAALLTALRMKGEVSDEVVGFATVMREKAEPLWEGADPPDDMLDTCGTGGDQSGTFNISTAAAFVLAGAGVVVAKHGNRSASSRCGSADVMEALGIDIQMPTAKLRRAITDVGYGFLLAPRFHSSTKHVVAVRRELRVRTVFNILGPLSNPAGATRQMVGVFSLEIMDLVAESLRGLGTRKALVVHGAGGLDEISLAGPTDVIEVTPHGLRRFQIEPDDFGVRVTHNTDLQGGDASENARIVQDVLEGRKGPHRDVVLINAAAGLVAAGRTEDFREAFEIAAESVDSGAARERLRILRAL